MAGEPCRRRRRWRWSVDSQCLVCSSSLGTGRSAAVDDIIVEAALSCRGGGGASRKSGLVRRCGGRLRLWLGVRLYEVGLCCELAEEVK